MKTDRLGTAFVCGRSPPALTRTRRPVPCASRRVGRFERRGALRTGTRRPHHRPARPRAKLDQAPGYAGAGSVARWPGDQLHALLLLRRGAPSAGLWLGAPEETPSFVLNLPAFHDPISGFDVEAFAAAIDTAGHAMRLLTPGACAVAMADLAGLLAALGLDYAGNRRGTWPACLAAMLRGRVDAALAGAQLDLLAPSPSWPPAPANCAVPGLAEAAALARSMAMRYAAGPASTAILPPGPIEALLGCETGGIAPAFAPVSADGLRPVGSRLAHRAGDLARCRPGRRLGGRDRVSGGSRQRLRRHARLHRPVPARHGRPDRSPCHRPRRPSAMSSFRPPPRLHAESRDWRAPRVPAHGRIPDGRLGEIGIALPRENAATRGLADSLAIAVSIGLQHGVPLEAFVGCARPPALRPAGAVRGRPGHRPCGVRAGLRLPQPRRQLSGPHRPAEIEPAAPPAAEAPLLPLDLPRNVRRPVARPALRLVG